MNDIRLILEWRQIFLELCISAARSIPADFSFFITAAM